MKKSGHIIIDGCTHEGSIMRMIYPRSQGKQIYYDARKSTWGDVFPHDPKSSPQLRYRATSRKPARHSGETHGSRKAKANGTEDRPSYTSIISDIEKSKKDKRKDRVRKEKIEQDRYFKTSGIDYDP